MNVSNPKCKVCDKTAYSQESISYDQLTYHKRCFRCTKCDQTISLRAVAQIQGDLYCKTCFLKLFKLKGTYHVFGDKTLPASMRGDSADNSAEIKSHTRTASAGPGPQATPSSELRAAEAAIVKVCVIDSCNEPRAPGRSWCEAHYAEHQNKINAQHPGVQLLINAVSSKNIQTLTSVIQEHGAAPILTVDAASRKSPLEYAYSSDGSAACAEALLQAVTDRLQALENQRSSIQQQLATIAASKNDLPVVVDDGKQAADAPAPSVDAVSAEPVAVEPATAST